MINEQSIVMSNKIVGPGLYVMTLRSPKIAASIAPGQFVHMEIPSLQANILRRPFSVYDADVEAGLIDILYQVKGSGTADMTKWQPGYLTTMIGSIGRAWFAPSDLNRALLVGGGVGAAPLFMLYKELVSQNVHVDVVLGASTKDFLVCHDRYCDVIGVAPHCATDDGTFGNQGFATVCVEDLLANNTYDYAAVCGPEPMMCAVAKLTTSANIETQVSLEKLMACGIGACLSCVCDTVSGKKRVCVDGPVYNVADLGW